MSTEFVSTKEVERELGVQFRALRLHRDMDQVSLAKQANIGLTALKNLEAGRGSSLRTVVRVARALGRLDWMLDLYREPEVSPLEMLRASRQSAARRRSSPRSRGES